MAGILDRAGDCPLLFGCHARDPLRQDLALVVDEPLEEFCVRVVDVFESTDGIPFAPGRIIATLTKAPFSPTSVAIVATSHLCRSSCCVNFERHTRSATPAPSAGNAMGYASSCVVAAFAALISRDFWNR